MTKPGTPFEKRFWLKVDKRRPKECWEWTGAIAGSGYGALNIDGKMKSAHRVSWEIHYGQIPQGEGSHGICVLHHCDNRSCVNPSHLFLGSNSDNIADCVAKGRHGHSIQKGGMNANAKLNEVQVRIIRWLLRFKSMTQKEIGNVFGVVPTAIGAINVGRTWPLIQAAQEEEQP